MEGFVFGLAVYVAVGQLPKLFGLTKGPGDTIRQYAHLITHLGEASWVTSGTSARGRLTVCSSSGRTRRCSTPTRSRCATR
jgi:Sulfate permease family